MRKGPSCAASFYTLSSLGLLLAVLSGCGGQVAPTTSQQAPASKPFITTVAGNGISGFNGDGLPALKTELYLPQDAAVGTDRELYFADWNNHRIRKITNGVVQTVAGTGELGDAQDGPALQIKFNHPTNIAFDPQGRMVIAAWHNSLVKRLDFTTGLIENLAGTGARAFGGDGGPGNSAKLDLPSSVVVADDGTIFISDQANYRIRRLDPDGTIHTICGDGVPGYSGDGGPAVMAELDSPKGQAAPPAGRITMDADGRIYIADTANHVIRMLDLDGTITTIVGTGERGYSGDNGPAVEAQLDTPSDVAVAPDGTIYIADTMNNAVRKVSPDGIITTVAGTGVGGFSGDGGPADEAQLDRPYGLTVAPGGDVYVCDTHNQRIRRLSATLPPDYNPDTGEPEAPVEIVPCSADIGSICTYAGTGKAGFNGDGRNRLETDFYWPFDIEFTPSGRTYVLDWNNHKVREIQADGTFKTVIGTDFVGDGPLDLSDLTPPGAPGTTVSLNHPTDLAEFPNGDLLLVAWHNHKIRVLDPTTGLVLVLAGGPAGFAGDGGPAKNALLNQLSHGVFDPAGNFFVVDQRNQRIRVLLDFADLRENAIITTVAGTGEPGFNGDGPALSTQFNFPTGANPEPTGGIALAADGSFYISDTLNHRIRRLQFTGDDFTSGVLTTVAGTGEPGFSGDGGPATAAQINYPEDLEIGPDGKLYFADTNNDRVRVIDLQTGIIDTVAGTGQRGYGGDGGPARQAKLQRPFGIAFDHNGDLYVSDTFNGRIRKINFSGIGGPQPLIPSDYRDTFVEVRDCRFSIAHGGVMIRVLANPIAAQPYLNNENPLPVGSILVKEEFNGSDCSDENLIGWRIMEKEDAGFDPEDDDWHWQQLSAHRAVLDDTKTTCVGCHRAPECLARDHMCTEGGTAPNQAVHFVLPDLPAALLSISGTAPDDVYTVGADPHDGLGPLVLHYDGQRWHRLHTGTTGDLWWITVTPIAGSFYMAGDFGTILRFDPVTATFERYETPGDDLLFGIWGSAPDDIWAVGGDPFDPDTGGVVWHFDGTTWEEDDDVGRLRPDGLPTIFKIWGRSATDVYAVGRLGVVLHFDGIRWSLLNSNTTRSLFSVHGNDAHVAAVGGDISGLIIEGTGGPFDDRTGPGTPQMNGVFIRPDGSGVAVGVGAALAFRNASGWQLQRNTFNTARDFHTAWSDPQGGIWAVGGDLSVDLTHGMLAYGGAEDVSSEIASDQPCPPGTRNGGTTVSYSQQVVPLFTQAGCLNETCHGGTFLSSEFDLRTYESSFAPGLEATSLGVCPLVPGDPDASYLIEKLGVAPRMGVQMPNGLPPLSSEDVDLIRTWILEGAQDDSPALPTATPTPTGTPPPAATPTATTQSCDAAGIICTVAGTGRSQFDGDGKPALETSFYYPFSVIFDAQNRPLILDFNNLRVRRIDSDGTIETIMGKDYEDFPTDGALAVDTPLHHASDLSFDTEGRLYVAGDHVPVVFRVGTDDRVFITAGTTDTGYDGDEGPALQAKLTTPFGVLTTAEGGYYISDVDAHVIRYVDPSGIIHTVAGNGTRGYSGDTGPALAAELNGPTRMRLDDNGDLYFCDTNNHVIRRIDTSGMITTVVGTGDLGYAGDGGPANQAQLSSPYDLRFSPAGDLYVADTGNNVIRRIAADGIITTVVGTGVRGFAGDGRNAQDAQFNRPSGLTFGTDGSLWIADTFNQRVRRIAGFLP